MSRGLGDVYKRQGYDTSGWNNGKVYVAIEEDAEAEHTIELRMNDESESKKFTLMAIGYN